MTLILSAIAKNCVVQISDRRLTLPDGSLYDDMAVKMICAACQNAHFSMSYTGLAEVKGVRTDERVTDYLVSIHAGNMPILQLLEATKAFLTEIFRQLKHLGNNRGVSFVLAGYVQAVPFMGLLSNMEDEKGNWLRNVDDDFHLGILSPNEQWRKKLDVMINGAEIAADVFEQYIPSFRKRFFNKPPQEISNASVQLLRMATQHPKIGHVIGKNCLSTIVTPDGEFVCNDHSEAARPQHNSPHFIGPDFSLKKFEIWTGDQPPPWW